MSVDDAAQEVTSATSAVWTNHIPAEEPPHSHPGDDMTVVVEGRVVLQFYRREAGTLVPDGEKVLLDKGDVGYIRAGRIHDARYVDACRLVYVHNGAFAFLPADAEVG